VESAGIHDILTKCLGSANKYNAVYATVAALKALRSPEDCAKARGKDVAEVASDYPVARFAVADGSLATPTVKGDA
jgi:ribosomal protein S5